MGNPDRRQTPWAWRLTALAVPALLALQSATFAYVVSIEKRLTRLESFDEYAKTAPRAK